MTQSSGHVPREQRMLRILHTESSEGWGGQELRIVDETTGLLARGHTVSILCSPDTNLAQEAKRRDLPHILAPISRKNMAGLKGLRRAVGQFKPDVVNTHSSTDSWLATLAIGTRRARCPIVRTRHISAEIKGGMTSRWLYRSAKAVVTTSSLIREHVMARTGLPDDRVHTIPTGVDLSRFEPATGKRRAALRQELGLDPKATYAVIVATLRSWKGHADLVKAFATPPLSDQNDLHLLMVGEGPQRPALEPQIASLGLEHRVHLIGHKHDVVPWLQASDLFVLASYANEGVPQALMQAMACGLPCVTSDYPALLEIVTNGETCRTFPARDVQAISDTIRAVADDTALRTALAAAARRNAEANLSQEVMLDRMEAVFRSVVR